MSDPDAPSSPPPLAPAVPSSPLGHDELPPAPASPTPEPAARLDDLEAPPAIDLVEPQHAPDDADRSSDLASEPSGGTPTTAGDDTTTALASAAHDPAALESVSLADQDATPLPQDRTRLEGTAEVGPDRSAPDATEPEQPDDAGELAPPTTEPSVPAAPPAPEGDGDGVFEDVSLSRAPSVVPAVRSLRDEVHRDAAELHSDTPMVQATAHDDAAPAADDLEPLPASAAASSAVETPEAAPASAAPAPAPAPASSAASTSTSAPAPSSQAPAPTAASSSSPRPADPAPRRESLASVTTVSGAGSSHLVSGILIVSSLESIAATKEAKRHKPLKDALDRALEALRSPAQPATPGLSGAAASAASTTIDPHVVFAPLRLACETRSLPVMITALDCLGKLVSYDFFVEQHDPDAPQLALGRDDDNESLVGGAAGGGAGASQVNLEALPLADQITSTVCDCFSPSPSNASSSSSSSSSTSAATTQHDTLLLRLLSCLLSLILSSSLPVHQSALLKAVRTVYNVFLLGRAGTVQTVAQATLGQIVGGVFGRVALDADTLRAAAGPTGASSTATAGQPGAASVGLGLGAGAGAGAGGGSGATPGPSRSASRTDLASVVEEEASASASAPGEAAADGGATGDEATEVAEPTPRLPQDGMEAPPDAPSAVEDGERDEAGAAQDGEGATPRVSVTQDGEDRGALEGQGQGEKITRENLARLNGTPLQPSNVVSTNDLRIKDAFLVFRALCKLSMKPLGTDSERDLKSPAMRSKLLSLHLILTVLNNHMPLFTDPHVAIISSTSRERTPFLTAVKQYLCLALSRNAVSPVIQVFELSCEVFSRMLSGMRQRLKKEIEVLLNEIFLPILEMRNSTVRQKSLLLAAFARLAQDPQALVDIYLNYDCDRSSLDNIYERLLNVVSKLGTTYFPPSTPKPNEPVLSALAPSASPFPLAATSLFDDSRFTDPVFVGTPPEAHIKRQSLECLVTVLRSLVSWAGRSAGPSGGSAVPPTPYNGTSARQSEDGGAEPRTSEADGVVNGGGAGERTPALSSSLSSSALNGGAGGRSSTSGANTPDASAPDDPSRFENAKLRKTTLLEGIKKFNFKPKRGVAFLVEHGFIRSTEPKDIARFLLQADGLDKAQIGEYLGEGEPENIAAMHAFVDFMEFTSMRFVDALRMFLQSFRLPGEAQKIDRYMLKFAERYTAGNPGTFANADTAYILAFSVILLNTDAHNPQVKKPMTQAEFIRNNRGIDDGKDLDEQFLIEIYDEINANEIRMKDEVEAAGPQAPAAGLAGTIASVGRDFQREAYLWQSETMVTKTEALFRTLVRGQRRGGRASDEYYSASHAEHVKPMFEVAWMPILAGISGPLQDSDDLELIGLALDGFKQAIKIVCLFDLELERNAFVTTLSKFTFLNNFGEMRPKNVECIKTLLDVAMVDGNYLKGSWRDVVTCVSQLERFQLIAQGVDSQALPELGRKPSTGGKRRSTVTKRTSRPTDEVAQETRSQHITITADMIFSSTPHLSGTAIADFVQALSDVSWEEIQSSGLAEQPRVFCLQKLVEICYYNMNRIRLEWSSMWLIIGEHFNQVTCHTNAKVSFLALDSLRQLAMRFLEKEELAHFKFQKDFLKPFEHAMVHNTNPDARDMVLQCLHQMIQSRGRNLRSGWRTMFGVFAAAAKVPTERIAVQAFDIVQRVNKDNFSQIVEFGSFADLTVCITDFCKVTKFQRVSLQAIELLKSLVPMMLACPECPLSVAANGGKPIEATATDDPMIRFWFPLLFGFYDVVMNGEDLEVRKRALDYLFDTLKRHGSTFPADFWDTICKEVLFPIFAVLRSRSDVSRFSTQEDMSVWLSTTMIQALRNLVDLFTFYFDALARMLDKLLDLLSECICQENDTLARIGTSCLQQLVEDNIDKLSGERWERIVSTFVQLFKTTTAYQLFDPTLLLPESAHASSSTSSSSPSSTFAPLSPPVPATNGTGAEEGSPVPPPKPGPPVDRRRVFRQIIVKCVLQLLLIETTHELLQNERVYKTIPPSELLRLMTALDESYRFARKFNADKDLRMALWKVGFMRDLPNLLRQESTSAATLVNVLLRMYSDVQPEHLEKRAEVVDVFAPLGLDVLANYVSLNPETQARNITAWTPVCTEILQGFCAFEDEPFKAQLPRLYPLVTNTLVRESDPTLREAVRQVFVKVGVVALGITGGVDGEEQ
ncbi:hypothetical protein JCM9279_002291 [Rhodotorula babjevae]